MGKKLDCQVEVNADALYIAMKSAYDDIERYKLYHLENPKVKKSNCVKRAAYLVKWFSKFAPLRPKVAAGDETSPPKLVPFLINIFFCSLIIRIHLEAELGVAIAISNDKVYALAYDLTFREINGDGLLAIVQDLYELAKQNKIVSTTNL